MTPLLQARDVALSGRLHPTSLAVPAGELVAVIGPNGGGKTSLLRCLADVERHAGFVHIDGEELSSAPPARRPKLLSFLPASREVVWPISARHVIALAASIVDAGEVAALLHLLELEPLTNRPINRLSTGERARVLLARALVAQPRVLLLDEPLSNLDPYWALRMLEILRDFVRLDERCAIVALHDLNQAEAFDRLVMVNEGRIIADGKPQAVLAGEALAATFGIERIEDRWRIRRSADPRSSR